MYSLGFPSIAASRLLHTGQTLGSKRYILRNFLCLLLLIERYLFLQFNDGKDFVYTIIRMPIRKMKHSPTSPVATSILNTKTMKGRKF